MASSAVTSALLNHRRRGCSSEDPVTVAASPPPHPPSLLNRYRSVWSHGRYHSEELGGKVEQWRQCKRGGREMAEPLTGARMQHHRLLQLIAPPPPQCLCVACAPGPGGSSSQPVSWSSPPEQHMIFYDYGYCLCPSSRRLQAGCAGGEEAPAKKTEPFLGR